MKAGRELDALIAEKVMGLRWVEETFESHHNGDECTVRKWINQAGSKVGEYGFCPRYSTNILDAWTIVEKMSKLGFHFLMLRSADSGLSIASFYMGPADRSDASRSNFEAPEAICRAALAAVV